MGPIKPVWCRLDRADPKGMDMDYRRLGLSGLKVSPLCLGTMMFGDRTDAAEAENLGIAVTVAHTLMTTLADREALAQCVLASADALAKATA